MNDRNNETDINVYEAIKNSKKTHRKKKQKLKEYVSKKNQEKKKCN